MKHIDDLLGPLAGGTLSGADRERAERHLKECRRCAGLVSALRSRRAGVRDLPGPRATDALVAKTLRKVWDEAEQEGGRAPWLSRLRVWWTPMSRPVTVLAGFIFIMLTGVAVLQRTGLMVPGMEQAAFDEARSVQKTGPTAGGREPEQKAPGGMASDVRPPEKDIQVHQGPAPTAMTPVAVDRRSRGVQASAPADKVRNSVKEETGGSVAPARESVLKAAVAPTAGRIAASPSFSAVKKAKAPGTADPSLVGDGEAAPAAVLTADVVLVRPASFDPGRGQTAEVRYVIEKPGYVLITVQNAAGKTVVTLLDGDQKTTGWRTVTWDGRDADGAMIPAGLYRVTVKTGEYQRVLTVGIERGP